MGRKFAFSTDRPKFAVPEKLVQLNGDIIDSDSITQELLKRTDDRANEKERERWKRQEEER